MNAFHSKNLISKVKALDEHHSVALILWCMDRVLSIFKVVTLENYQSERLLVFVKRSAMLWNWGVDYDYMPLKDFCEDFNIEAIKIKSINQSLQDEFFFGFKSVSESHLSIAILDNVSMLYAMLRIRSNYHKDIILAGLEMYYNIYYQPTFDSLIGDDSITPNVYKRATEILENTDPLMTALRLLEVHVELLNSIERIDFSDPRLRGIQVNSTVRCEKTQESNEGK